MSDRTFCWLFVWIVGTFGWFDKIIHEQYGQPASFAFAAIGGGLLIGVLERRMTREEAE
jgi:hypothetical protein